MMDIKTVKEGESNLADFIRWLDGVDDISYDIEDWDNMCGVNVHCLGSTCFNFYDDGKFRAIIDVSDESRYARELQKVKDTIKHMSWWEFFANMWGV